MSPRGGDLLAPSLLSIKALPDQDHEPAPLVDDVALGLESRSAGQRRVR